MYMENNLRNIRKDKKLTLNQLAELADTSAQQIQRLEKGDRKLTPDWLSTLSKALNCTAVDILPELAGNITDSHNESVNIQERSKKYSQAGLVKLEQLMDMLEKDPENLKN